MSKKIQIALLLWTLLLAGTDCAGPSPEPVRQAVLGAELWVSDTTVRAGNSVEVAVVPEAGALDNGWLLVWSDAYGDAIYPGQPERDRIRFSIPDIAFQRSGLVELGLCRNGRILDRKQLVIQPGDPEEVIESYAGAKTMVVNSRQEAMIVAIPKDRFGNPVAGGTPVDYTLRYPGRPVVRRTDETEALVSSILLPSREEAGKILVGVSAGTARSVEETIEETPGWPAPFTLEVESWLPFADPRQNIILRTGFINDALGNRVADGTLVHMVIEEAGRVAAKYRGFTSSGSARVQLFNPERATTWKIYAVVEGGIRSANVLTLEFTPYVQPFEFRYEPAQETLVIGPVSGKLGQMVTDDLPVQVTLATPDTSYFFTGMTENGICIIPLPVNLPRGRYAGRVVAGGRETTKLILVN